MDEHGHYTGEDFERRVHALVGWGSRIASGALSQRTTRFDPSQAEESLNSVLVSLWNEYARRAPERVSQPRDFTYPEEVERIRLRHTADAGAGAANVGLPSPFVALVRLEDRRYDHDEPPIRKVDADVFWREPGVRWAYDAESLFFSDAAQLRGPSEDWPLRLYWIPHARRIDRTSKDPREDLPLEMHEPLCLGAAAALAVETGQEKRAAALEIRFEKAKAAALGALGQTDRQPRFVRWTRAPLSMNSARRGALRGISR